MSGANIFVIYASADGSNVTLSTRRGTGHTEPQFSSNAQVSLLEGSGIVNGKMIANVKCTASFFCYSAYLLAFVNARLPLC